MSAIADVQSSVDKRNMPINQVGIKNLRLPICIDSAQGTQQTVADLMMTVSLPADQKGTHMSRFIELMQAQQGNINFSVLRQLTQTMVQKLDAVAGKIKMNFPFFRQKHAPVTAITSLMDYQIELCGEISAGQYQKSIQVMVPVTSL